MEKLKEILTKEESPKAAPGSGSEVPVQKIGETFEPGESKRLEPIYVKKIDLSGPGRVGEIVSELRGGNIIVSEIGQLMDENPEELKESVDRLKGMIGEINGQVARLSETMIIAAPEFVNMRARGED